MNDTTRTRSGSGRLATMACLVASLLAGSASAIGAPPGAARSSATMRAYPIIGAAAKGVAGKLKEMYSNQPDVEVLDTPAGHVVVTGPATAQEQIGRWLAAQGLIAPATPQPVSQPVQPIAPSEPQRIVTQSWQLRSLSARDFEAKLSKTWGAALQSSQDPVGDVATFRFPPTAAGTTSIVVDRRTGTATVAAPQSSTQRWQRLLAILDSRPTTPDERTSVVPLVKSDPSTIRRAVSILQQIFTVADAHRKQHIGQFVSMFFQQQGAGQGGAAQPAGGAQPAAPAAGAAPPADTTTQAVPSGGAPSVASMEAIARINNVQIEILDDVIVVRGRREDVERVLQIIEQIEQQSIQYKPEIELFHLKHIDSFALAEMIGQATTVYNAAFSRQGQTTIIPLQRPNAVLIIGRKENIPSIVELIAKLDVPAPTDAEFKIFRLQNMSAIDAERTMRGFFVTRPPTDTTLRQGLGTRALVIADYRSNSLLVQAAPRDMIEVTRIISEIDVPASGITNEVRVFRLRNSIAETLAPVLEDAITGNTAGAQAQTVQSAAGQATPPRATPPAISLQFLRIGPDGEQVIKSGIMANVRISADARSNTLIVVGPPASMNLMAALIERLDQLPASEAQIKVFQIRNGDATALAEMLQNLFGQAQQAQQQAVGQVTATGAGESAIVPLRFSVDQRTNSIIASGNAGDLNVIYHILVRLDEGDIRKRQTAVYRLRNAPAADVANALTQLLAQQIALIQSAPELITPVETLDQQVIVVPEAVTNSIIVSATERRFGEINRMIETLDRRPPMVVIQVVIAEVTLQENEAFGVEWGLQDALMFDRSSSAALTSNRFNFNSNPLTLPNDSSAASLATAAKVATQGVSNLALGRTDQALGFGGLVLTASSESVSVLLRALERSQRAQIISRPQVQTVDNQIAYVQVGARVPRIIGANTTALGTVQPQVTDVPVGIILQVTPRVSLDGTIALQMYAEKSSVGPDATGIPIAIDTNGNAIKSPQIPITTAQTTVLARSGQTVILGGLITKDLEEETRRIPYLADIPVLGKLFRYDIASNKRTELLIIMTPYVVTSPDQIDWMNARESARMSWCLADLINIHGPVPNMQGNNPMFNPSPTPLIFPDIDPRGYPAGPTPYSVQAVDISGMSPNVPGTTTPGPSMPYPSGTPPYSNTAPPTATPPYATPPYATPPYSTPPGPTPAVPTPAVPPPPAPGLPPPPPPSGAGYGFPARNTPPESIVVPQPPSLMQPGATGASGPLAPPTIESVAPPAGTARAPAGGFRLPVAQQPVAPAEFQQPIVR